MRHKSQPYCRKCGGAIYFFPLKMADGFYRSMPHNVDNKQPHFRRCKINQDLAKAKAEARADKVHG